MAQFGSLFGSGVALPVWVLIIVLTIVNSLVTGQETSTETSTTSDNTSETETYSPTTADSTTPELNCTQLCNECERLGEKECTDCSANNTERKCKCELPDEECPCQCTTGTDKWLLIGAIAGGVVLLILVLVIIICCCRMRGPPKPVARDFRLSTDDTRYPQTGEFPSDDEASIVNNFETHATSDDIYGNVDNQGNVIRFNMPNEIERSPTSDSPGPKQQDFDDNHENNIPSLPTTISPSQEDFGGVYENTQIGNVTQPVTTSRHQPRATPSIPVRPSPTRKEEEDFGGLYTNEPIHLITNSPFNITNELLQRNQASADSHQAPAVPRRPAPQTASQPSMKRPTKLPLTQQDNSAFEGDDHHGNVDLPLPQRPAPTANFSQSLRVNPVALVLPNPGSKFNSLPGQSRETPTSHFTQQDDLTDQPMRSPPAPPSQKPKKQTYTKPLQSSAPTHALKSPSPPKALKPVQKKKGKVPPKTSPKGQIDRYINDDVKGEIEMGARQVPSTPDHGEVYEVVESPFQKDFGENYEVCDIQPKPPPKEDFGLSYEYVDQVEDSGSADYNESYELVEPHSTPDYGGDYELVERPPFDISHRAPMPTPESAAPYRPPKPPSPAKKKPALPKPVTNVSSAGVARSSHTHHGNSEQDSDNDDWGEDYTNVPAPGGGTGRTHPPTHRPQPPLPEKLNSPKRMNDFYDDILQAGDDEKEDKDDNIYRNDAPGVPFTPGKHYRNVPAKREQPQRQGNYIQLQGKGH